MRALLSDIPSMKSDLPRNFKDGAGRWFYLSFIICVEWIWEMELNEIEISVKNIHHLTLP